MTVSHGPFRETAYGWPSTRTPALIQMGMSASMADLLLEMAEALNSGYMRALEPRSAENTTPTSIETFVAEEFVPRCP